MPTIEEWHREILAVDAAVKRFRAEANGSIGAGATQNNAARRAGSAAIQRALESAVQTMRDELQRLQRARADKPNIIEANGTLGAAPFVVNAQAPVQAVFVKKVPYTLLAMAATMMLGLAFTAVRGLFAVGGSAARNRTAIDVVAGSGPMMSRAVPAARGADRAGVRKTVPVPVAARMPPVSVSGSHAPVAAGSFSSMSHYALHLIDELPVEGGYRLLITGASEAVDPSDEVIDLVAELSDAGLSVLLVDWSLDGERLHSDIEIGAAASLSDVMSGHAEFDDILVTLPDSNLHYIYSTDARVGGELLNEDDLNLVLDALDEAYDHVIVAGGYNDTRALFEAIQGRFDAGMTIADATIGTAPVNGDSFLGFDVADIEVVQFVRPVDQSGANRQPMDTEGGNVNVRL